MSVKKEKEVRVLTFSIDVWNKLSGSDTLPNLFSGYRGGRIANVYFKSGIPDNLKCDRYFFVSENQILKNLFRRNAQSGMRVIPDESGRQEAAMNQEQKKESFRYHFFSRYRLWMFQCARELIWKFGRWNSSELEGFVREFSPNVLFFPIEGYLYFNRITEYFMKKLQIPAVGIIWDDNFSYKAHPLNPCFLIHRFFLRRQVRRISGQCSAIYTITPKMKKELYDVFGVSAEILTKGAEIQHKDGAIVANRPHNHRPIRIVYTGKLNIGRFDAVQLLAKVIERMNMQDTLCELYVYSGTELSRREKKKIEKKGCHFMGCVPQNQIAGIQEQADVLLLAEALRGTHKYDARLSFSTKTVDYLAKGKCILYMGTEDNATAEYLRTNDVALFSSTYEQTMTILKKIVSAPNMLERYGNKAYSLAVQNHDIRSVQTCLYDTIITVGQAV